MLLAYVVEATLCDHFGTGQTDNTYQSITITKSIHTKNTVFKGNRDFETLSI